LPNSANTNTSLIMPRSSAVDPDVLGLLRPDPDPLVRDTDPDPSIIKQK
jgi:hypothetical protein